MNFVTKIQCNYIGLPDARRRHSTIMFSFTVMSS